MQRVILYFMAFIFFYTSPVMAAEAILPIKVQIISKETWQKMQQGNLQSENANGDALPTDATTSIYDESSLNTITDTDILYAADSSPATISTDQAETGNYNLTANKTLRFFNRLNTDNDDTITLEEYLDRGGRRATEDSFAQLDTDGSGQLDLIELSSFF